MKILFVTTFNNVLVKETNILPRIGDCVDMFYEPFPRVTKVILYPKPETFKSIDENLTDIDAIILVD